MLSLKSLCLITNLIWAISASEKIVIEKEIYEEISIGKQILNLTEEIKNIGHNYYDTEDKKFNFELENAEDYKYFELKPKGQLLVRQVFDRERLCNTKPHSCRLSLRGIINEKDLIMTKQVDQFKLVFTIIDLNDNRPECQNRNEKIYIDEDIEVGKTFFTMKIVDSDFVANGITSVRLEPEGSPFSLNFISHANPPWTELVTEISTSRPLLGLSKEYYLKIVITDGFVSHNAPRPITTNCSIIIAVKDINNHTPQWVEPNDFMHNHAITMEIYEGQTVKSKEIIKFAAKDEDTGENARITYSIVGKDRLPLQKDDTILKYFEINPTTGWFSSKYHPIDFERLKQDYTSGEGGMIVIKINLSACDNPTNDIERRCSPIGEMNLRIIDINDNSPAIKITSLFRLNNKLQNAKRKHDEVIEVQENIKNGSVIATVLVSDEDSEQFLGIVCTLKDLDENDVSIGTSKYFKIIENEKIVTLTNIDRESKSEYKISLICSDNEKRTKTYSPGKFINEAKKMIHVVVIDMNDNMPRFIYSENETDSFVCQVEEHAKPGKQICQLKFKDDDSSDITQHMWQMNSLQDSILEIDKTSGWVSISKSASQDSINAIIDRETHDRIRYSVYLEDYTIGNKKQYDYRINTTLIIVITDKNDNAPIVEPLYMFNVYENEQPGTLIGQIVARDIDEELTPNSALAYRIIKVNNKRETSSDISYLDDISKVYGPGKNYKVSIYSQEIDLDLITGELRVGKNARLDREEIQGYELIVEVSDGNIFNKERTKIEKTIDDRHISYTRVLITISDINDNAPSFIFPEKNKITLTFSCGDLKHLPMVVAQIKATDADESGNNEISYSVENCNHVEYEKTGISRDDYIVENLFFINSKTGELSINEIDSERMKRFCENESKKEIRQMVKVVASDNGSPVMSSEAFVTIRYTDYQNPQWPQSRNFKALNSKSLHDQRRPSNIGPFYGSSSKVFWIATICLAIATFVLLFLIFSVCYLTIRQKHQSQTNLVSTPNHRYPHPHHITLGHYNQPQHQEKILEKQKVQTYNQLHPLHQANTLNNNYMISSTDMNEDRYNTLACGNNAYQTLASPTTARLLKDSGVCTPNSQFLIRIPSQKPNYTTLNASALKNLNYDISEEKSVKSINNISPNIPLLQKDDSIFNLENLKNESSFV